MIFSGLVVRGRLKKALDLLNCGMYVQAAVELNEILRALEDQKKNQQIREPIHFYLAECYMSIGDEKMEQRDLPGALEAFEKAAFLDVNFPDLYYRIGQVHLAMNEPGEAEQALTKALVLNPRYQKARLTLADVYRRQGLWERSAREYRSLHEQGVLCDEERYAKGLRHIERGEQEAGIVLLHESFQDKPDPVQALYVKGVQCYNQKDYTGAIAELKKVLEEHPDYPDIHNFLGVAFCGVESYEEAEAAFRKAVMLNPDYIEPRLNLAFLCERLGKPREASGLFREILSIDPENVIAQEGLESLQEAWR